LTGIIPASIRVIESLGLILTKEFNMTIDKAINDGMVAILYSPGFGAGWSSWNQPIAE
jgi:hypothetical protein